MDVLAAQVVEYMEFYQSLAPEDLQAGFNQDYRTTQRVLRDLKTMSQRISPEYSQKINNILAPVDGAQNNRING
jgi:ferritin-like metal-binding protein YciE